MQTMRAAPLQGFGSPWGHRRDGGADPVIVRAFIAL
ncbi:hypothetical protein HNR61_009040 [Actinomadura namibiensis]|uniref:Uncharacterized protein n=1 Tax=Actinomadura namibiensis TaxID=182080 RepID=A0A7W3M011_ACTNM|nr:hypothetical protein [Actinomadura namibiensis]